MKTRATWRFLAWPPAMRSWKWTHQRPTVISITNAALFVRQPAANMRLPRGSAERNFTFFPLAQTHGFTYFCHTENFDTQMFLHTANETAHGILFFWAWAPKVIHSCRACHKWQCDFTCHYMVVVDASHEPTLLDLCCVSSLSSGHAAILKARSTDIKVFHSSLDWWISTIQSTSIRSPLLHYTSHGRKHRV